MVEKGAKKRNMFWTGAKVYLREKKLGVRRTLTLLPKSNCIVCMYIELEFTSLESMMIYTLSQNG